MAAATPESIRDTTAEVLKSKTYRLDFEENAFAPLWERMLEMLYAGLGWIAGFFSFLDGLPQFVRWVIIMTLVVLMVLLVGHILYSIFSALSPGRKLKVKSFERPEHRDDPRQWETEANQLAGRGEYIEAARLLLKSSLFRLEESFNRPFRQSTTNREYLRKYRQLPTLAAVQQLVETIDRKWYGEEPCVQADFEQCRNAHQAIIEALRCKSRTRAEVGL